MTKFSVGRAALISLLVQFANCEQFFDKTPVEPYAAAVSDPKKERKLPAWVLACLGVRARSGGRFSPDSMRPWKGQYNLCPCRLSGHGLNQGRPVAGKSAAKHTGYIDQ
jgi:hypothetical protein